jgi:glucose-1-phosphate thymidylyltransferase
MKNVKGIILAGGQGTRLYPLTKVISKQLLPIFDKPMVYYPLSVLMLAKIKEVNIITSKDFIPSYKSLLADGSQLGMKFNYITQDKPRGIAEALILSKKNIGRSDICLILGDNIFYGNNLTSLLSKAKKNNKSTIFTYRVSNPQDYGVIKRINNKIVDVVEKPNKFIGNQAVVGLYFYKNHAIKIAEKLKPSKRGELEITDLNKILIKNNKINEFQLNRGNAWMDAGSFQSYLDISNMISVIQKRQSISIGCVEEIALRNKWISKKSLFKSLGKYPDNDYKKYIISILKD